MQRRSERAWCCLLTSLPGRREIPSWPSAEASGNGAGPYGSVPGLPLEQSPQHRHPPPREEPQPHRQAEPRGSEVAPAPGSAASPQAVSRVGTCSSPTEPGWGERGSAAAAHGWDGASSKVIRLLSWPAAFPATLASGSSGPSLFTTTSSSSSSMLGQAVWSSTRFSRSFSAFRASCLQSKGG